MYKDCTHAIAWETTARKAQQQQQPAVAWRRGRGIFPPMSVVPANDGIPASATAGAEDEPDQGVLVSGGSTDHGNDHDAERFLSNGDFYAGTWSRNLPHGAGKYLWSDGCMYVGEWRHGSATGTGKFSWPSGATYEGEFRSGFLDGIGTFTGSSGDTYHGSWSMNLKHGWGKKSYSNGDYYNGEWSRGSQDGQGCYVWRSGDEYTGSWKAGAIHGKGVLTWASGNCYDGDWEGGAPCGKGRFRWADGSCYVGIWSKGASVEESVFYPSQKALNWWGTEASFLQKQETWRLYKLVSSGGTALPRRRATAAGRRAQMKTNRSGYSDLSKHAGEFDEICVWESEGDNTWRGIVDGSAVVGAGRGRDDDGSGGVLQEEGSEGNAVGRQLMNWVPRGVRMQGETIAAGHRNYELMLSLQLGIRHSVGKTAPATTLDLEASAFDTKEKVWTRFPPEGTKHTPPHQSYEFKWKDYCPLVFRTLREIFKIDAADYMISMCGNDALRKLSSPGKSGSLFYLSHDDRYMIKTIKKSEVKVLLRMLPAYYNHVRAFESSLVTKFFGLHCVKFTGPMQRKIRFIIMENLFFSEYSVHRRFDLKGSSHGRITDKPDVEINETSTLKDLDLNLIFWLHRSWFQMFQRQIDRDCEFLEQERVMDYSLLVGLHFRGTSMPRSPLMNKDVAGLSSAREATSHLPRADMDKFQHNPPRWAAIKLGVNMPARVQQTQRSDCDSQPTGEPTGELFDVVLFFGIIDILQDYDISKKLEHAYKSFQYDPTSISAVDPKQYSRRFRQFIFKVFREDSYDDIGCLTITPVSIR